jgi:hypothetical protein
MKELSLFIKYVHVSLEKVLRIDIVTKENLSCHFSSKLCELLVRMIM